MTIKIAMKARRNYSLWPKLICHSFFFHNIHPPTTKTRFLTIYCPTRVNPTGGYWKEISGKINKGVKVPRRWIKYRIRTGFLHWLIIKQMPKVTSQTAIKVNPILPDIWWKLSMSTVFITRLSAGLNPGKNLSKPNQRYIMPRLYRRYHVDLY